MKICDYFCIKRRTVLLGNAIRFFDGGKQQVNFWTYKQLGIINCFSSKR